jgi:GMP synthase (glutamine-hydrolysing)
MKNVPIVVLDFGSQYTQLIARRLREEQVYCEIVPFKEGIDSIKSKKPQGIILSGGPASVYDKDAFKLEQEIFELGVPVLGICYGMQLITVMHGGDVVRADHHEYGKANLEFDESNASLILTNTPSNQVVWMSHADRVQNLPDGFRGIAYTQNAPYAFIANEDKKIYAMQFHPEVAHSEFGQIILKNFAREICQIKDKWTMEHFLKEQITKIKAQVGDKKVLCALSGGVDSSVVTALLYEAIGDNLIPIFVDNGLLRAGEREKVEYTFKNLLEVPLIVVDAKDKFMSALAKVSDPEQKRKIIGHTFIEVFDSEAKKHDGVEFLAQGTLYPDVIESVSVKGPSKTIKSHHNVGGLPDWMEFELIEPLRELFKDEGRLLGLELGLPEDVVYRQPFPGPGLAIRVMGEVNQPSLELLKQADTILLQEIKAQGIYNEIWQSFVVLLNVNSVGVMGDNRTYENAVAIRMVNSTDGMTANFAKVDWDILENISRRIINEVDGINRVVYDISTKPPATIEWE